MIANVIAREVENGSVGGTLNVESGGEVKIHSGYVVGGCCDSFITDRDGIQRSEVRANINRWVWENRGSANNVGFWMDSETGYLYIDFVDVIADFRTAIETARDRGEIAIWDGLQGVEVRTADALTTA